MADFLTQTGIAIIDPLYTLWVSFSNILPGLIAAIIVLFIGYFVGLVFGHAVRLILEKIGLDRRIRKARLTKEVGHTHVPAILGEITKWYIFIIFLQVAVDLLNLGTLTVLLDRFITWLPNLIAAILIVLFGFAVAHFIDMKIVEHSKMKGVKAISTVLKVVIGIIVIVIALSQIGIDTSILENSFLLLVAGLALGIALALGIGLGLSLKGGTGKWLGNFKKNF